MDNVVDLNRYRTKHQDRDLEKALIMRKGRNVELLADALDILRKTPSTDALAYEKRVRSVWMQANTRLLAHPGSPDLWLAKGAMELLLERPIGFQSINSGICDYAPDSFSIAFARYAIERSPFPDTTKQVELQKILDTYEATPR